MISKELAETWINELWGFVKLLPDNSYPIWEPHVRHYEILHVGIKVLKYLSTLSPLILEQDNPRAVTWHSLLIRAVNIPNPPDHLLPRRTGLLTELQVHKQINKHVAVAAPTANALVHVWGSAGASVCKWFDLTGFNWEVLIQTLLAFMNVGVPQLDSLRVLEWVYVNWSLALFLSGEISHWPIQSHGNTELLLPTCELGNLSRHWGIRYNVMYSSGRITPKVA